jgi:hypothetical protein
MLGENESAMEDIMRKIALAVAAAATLGLAAPAVAAPAHLPAPAVTVKAGHSIHLAQDFSARRHHCRVFVTKVKRHGRVVMRKVRRCR